MFDIRKQVSSERGVALVMALLVLLVMSLLAAVLMMSISINRKIAGHDVRRSQALYLAEAGVGEALARMKAGDITLNTANPKAVAQLFLTTAGTVPVLGTDSIAVETKQPTGQWLTYSTPSRSPDALTITFKTDAPRTVIYKYDQTKNPPIQTASGLPIFALNVTGQKGADVRRIVTEVIQKPINAQVKAALAANLDIDFGGNGVVCGYNHRIDTPPPTGEDGRLNSPSCVPYETGSGNLPGSWSTGDAIDGGASYQTGDPVDNATYQTGFYQGPWDALGMTQADFWAWVGTRYPDLPDPANGIYYIDNDGIAQNQSGNFDFGSGTGEGLVYVDGDLTINNQFVFKGLVYVEGDFKLNGSAWILGGLIVRGKSSVKQTGGSTVLYSSDAIAQYLAKYGGQFVTLSWRER